MKKLLLFTTLAVLFMGNSHAQDIVNLRMDASWQGLRGSVATLDEDVLVRKDYFREDWPTRKWFRQDLRNCLMEENGRILTFNASGHLTSVTYTSRGVAGKKTTCSYASNGLLTSYLGEGYRVEAKYKGTEADINIYAETKNYSHKVDLLHDDLANAPYSNTYPFDMKCRQQLSANGSILSSNYYYVDSIPARKCTYQYNHRNQISEEQIFDYSSDPANPQHSTITYSYDKNDLLSQKTVRSVSVNDVYIYTNNEHGDCERLSVESPYGTMVYTYEYEYDDFGNWTMRLQFKNGSFDCATLRTITYHKNSVKPNNKEISEVSHYEEEEPAPETSTVTTNEKKGLFHFIKKSNNDTISNANEKSSPKVDKSQPKSKDKTDKKSSKKAKVETTKAAETSMPDEVSTNNKTKAERKATKKRKK